MPGIQSDPRGDIQKIRELLKDYEPGFAFLKELIQNADDAGAGTLRLAWIPGAPACKHPLLGAPALVALNDGVFEAAHRDGLMRMGLGSKGGDAGQIGKFGLGTKSIFHVAEAFFFLESGGESTLRNILNPWSPRHHQEWDTVNTSDWDYIHGECGRIAEGVERWFALWVPLRRREDLHGIKPIMGGELAYPGRFSECPDSLRAPFLHRGPKLGELLGLLRSLETVEFDPGDGQGLRFHMDRGEGGAFTLRQAGEEIAGHILETRIEGLEDEWRERPDWPQVIDTRDDGEEDSSPDKAQWQHAVILTTTGSEQPKLRVYWSVFLPVGRRPYCEIELEGGERDISLFLHGFFFLNSSRTMLDGLDEDFDSTGRVGTAKVCRDWNRTLACGKNGLLPMLLKGLMDWHEAGNIQTEELAALTRAIRRSKLWKSFEKPMTLRGSVAYSLHDGVWGWRWISSDHAASVVPKIKSCEELQIFEKLTANGHVEDGRIFVVDVPGYNALKRELIPFDNLCLGQLRAMIGDNQLTDERARLLCDIIEHALAGREWPSEWCDVALFPVRHAGSENRFRLTLIQLQEHADAGRLFTNEVNQLGNALMAAVPDVDPPLIAVHDLPIGVEAEALTVERAAEWLLKQDQLTDAATGRRPLFRRFAREDHPSDEVLRALRYLTHAEPAHRDDCHTVLFFAGNNAHWNDAFGLFLNGDQSAWKVLNPIFVPELNERIKERAELRLFDAESWGPFLRSLGAEVEDTDFFQAGNATLEWILMQTPDEDLEALNPLKLHRLRDDEMVSANDETIWLDGGIEVPDSLEDGWRTLRGRARILRRPANPALCLRLENLFLGRVLDVSGALKLAASLPDPSNYSALIMHFLRDGNPRSEASDALRNAAWLPLNDGGAVAPNEVMHLAGAGEALRDLLEHFDNPGIHSSEDLALEVRDSAGWPTLSTQILPRVERVFSSLCDKVPRNLSAIAIGCMLDGEDELRDWLDIWGRCNAPDVFPCRAFFQRTIQDYPDHTLRLAILVGQPFHVETSTQRYFETIDRLRQVHENSPPDIQLRVLKILALYLKSVRESDYWDALKRLENLCLPNANGNWVAAGSLAAPCAGVQRDVLLHSDMADALGLGLTDCQLEGEDGAEIIGNNVTAEESAQCLRNLLSPFRRSLEEKAVAILPTLLGIDPDTESLTAEMLDGIQPATIKDQMISRDVMANGVAVRDLADQWIFRVRMIPGTEVELASIAGPSFMAPLMIEAASVFLPHPNGQFLRWHLDGDQNIQILCVAEPGRFAHLGEQQLREILVESIRVLLDEGYNHRLESLDEIVRQYMGLGQMSLNVARLEILSTANTHLQILGVRPPALELARKQLEQARTRRAEAAAGIGNYKTLVCEANGLELDARDAFLDQFETNPSVQLSLLQGMRRRIEDQQYKPDSIPFEIFQNADDAAIELHENADLTGHAKTMSRRFVFEVNVDRMYFQHAGRPINSACGLTGQHADRFRRDLVKMLLLNGSDKNTADTESLTGRFGLGFKSVFLLSDSPCVSSGRLAFEILGGIWPRKLDDESINHLHAVGVNWFPDASRLTTLMLPVAEDRMGDLAEIQSRFVRLSPFLPVFARHLRSIEIRMDGQDTSHSWAPLALAGSTNTKIGSADGLEEGRWLVFEQQESEGAIQWLFSLRHGTLEPLLGEIPWLWVTAPTRERSLGFALNGPFALDPGRTRLSSAGGDHNNLNQGWFRKAARLLKEEFSAIAINPDALNALGAGKPYAFWESLWKLMTNLSGPGKEQEGVDVLSESLWPFDGGGGYTGLIEEVAVMPNGLNGKLQELTRPSEIKHAIKGWMTTPAGMALLLRLMNEGLVELEINGCCSHGVAKILRERMGLEVDDFELVKLISSHSYFRGQMKPEVAAMLGESLWPDVTNPTESDLDEILKPEEAADLRKNAAMIHFIAADGNWHPADRLLLGAGHLLVANKTDEGRRFRFAPASRQLSADYSVEAVKLFLALRERFEAPVVELAEWARGHDGNDVALIAVFEYLAYGELRQPLAWELGQAWLRRYRDSACFMQLRPEWQQAIGYVFQIARIENERRAITGETIWQDEPDDEEEPAPAADAQQGLRPQALVDEWNELEARELFTISGPLGRLVTGTQSNPDQLVKMLLSAETLAGKSAWYRLLCLGCTLSMPLGIRPLSLVQRLWHEDLTEDFWKATIPPNLQASEDIEFNSNLDVYFEKRIHMLFRNENASGENAAFWRRVFYDFRKMHHFVFRNHLPETVLEFANCDEADGNSLIQFLRSGQIPDSLQHPGTARFRGVIGQSMKAPLLFVMRELRLLNLLDSRFDSACFYMNSPARRIARRLGWIDPDSRASGDFATLVVLSEQVHGHMCNELPDLAQFFDLPLQLYALKNPR